MSAVFFVVVLAGMLTGPTAPSPTPRRIVTVKAYRDVITLDDVDAALRVGDVKQRIAALDVGFDDASRLILTRLGVVLADAAPLHEGAAADAPLHVTYAVRTCVCTRRRALCACRDIWLLDFAAGA